MTVASGVCQAPPEIPGRIVLLKAYRRAADCPVAVVLGIKLEAGVPATARVTLEVGGTSEVAVVEAGADIVQSQTANIATTMGSTRSSTCPW